MEGIFVEMDRGGRGVLTYGKRHVHIVNSQICLRICTG